MDDIDIALDQIIASAGDSFDSHDIIRWHIRLLGQSNGEKLFQALHSSLGRRIKVICERHGFVGEASNSLDVFNQNSNCIAWSRD